jgi:hypothetical protein
MRYAFIALIVCACGVVRGEDAAALPSVVNHGQPAPIASPASVVENDCACENSARESCACAPAYGRRFGRARFRTVTESCNTCTGQTVRSVTRGVVRGAGAAVHTVGETAVNVITLPGRVCRDGRCSCN